MNQSVTPTNHAYANLWPAHGMPAGLCLQFDRKLIPGEQEQIWVAMADYNVDHRIGYHVSFTMCDEFRCARVYLRASFREEFTGEKMLRDSFSHVLQWLSTKTKIKDIPDGFTGQESLIIPLGVDPRQRPGNSLAGKIEKLPQKKQATNNRRIRK